MNETKGNKVAIIGAGAVGASIAFSIAMKQICSELVLIDVNIDKAKGEVMDIVHGLPFLGHMVIKAGGYEECKDCDLIIVTAGIPRKPGETRMDLAAKNVKLSHTICNSIMENYTKGTILIVSNPCDVNTYMFAKWSNLPAGRVFGSGTNLDSARFRSLLCKRLGVDIQNVHAYMLGEHGETQFPAWSASHIAGVPVLEYAKLAGKPFSPEEQDEFSEATKKAGANIISLKGATFYGIAVSCTTLAETILRDEHTIRPVCAIMNGEYGYNDVSLNVPCMIGKDGIEKVIEFPLTDEEKAKLALSEQNIRLVIDQVKDL
ncbi:MAG: L-lactate dehydrogenase [Saccharofermentans sp.]|nr:L-lactate dehydrogenase [Saccharofermentans sp.]